MKNDKESDWEDQQEGHPTDSLSDDQDKDIDLLDGGGQDDEDRAAEISELSRNQVFGQPNCLKYRGLTHGYDQVKQFIMS